MFPFADGSGRNVFACEREVACYAENSAVPTGAGDRFQQFLVSVRRLDEYLGLVAGNGLLLQFRNFFYPFAILDGQVTVEYEALRVQSRGHERQQYGRGPHEWNHPDFFLVGKAHEPCAGIGYSRAARFR